MGLGFGGIPETFAAALRLSAAFADGSAPPPPLDPRGEPVAPSSTRVVAEAATLRRALEAAAEAVEMNDEEPLPAAALALVFPVCAKALLLPDSAPAAVRKLALDVLAPHAAPGVEGLPRAPAAALALTVLEHGAPQLAAGARPLLFEVAAGAGDDEDGGDAVAATLLRGVESQFRAVRAAALAALLAAPPAASSDAQRTLFLARHDPDDDNRATAEQVWTAYGLAQSKEAGSSGGSKVPPADLLRYLTHEAAAVRDAAVGAFAEAVAESEQGVAPALAKLFAAFSQNSPKEEEEEMDADDPFAAMDRKRRLATFPGEEASTRSAGDPQARAAIMRALGAVAPSLTPRDLPLVSTFLTKVLGDDDELVRDAAMTAGRNMIELHGAEQVQQLLEKHDVRLGGIACYRPGAFKLDSELAVARQLGDAETVLVTMAPGDCTLCGKPLDVSVSSKGPHYCTEMCEQMRSESENLNETLSIDANFVDIDELEGFAELDHTVASSQEEIARAQQEASYEEARRKNHKDLFGNLR